MTRFSTIIVCLLTVISASAQCNDSIVKSIYAGVGATNILDTYLSQEKYTGTEVRLLSNSKYLPKPGRHWGHELTHQGMMQFAKPRSKNSDYIGGMYNFNYAARRLWQFSDNLCVEAGGATEAGVGFLYNTRNSNNPAQGRLYLNVGASVCAYYGFQLFRKRMTIEWNGYVPVFGALFSPNYGQSYYEIFTRGNYDHNCVVTTPFCAPTLRHQLILSIPLHKCALRLGYLGDYQQAKVNNLKYHTYSHLLVLGFSKTI